MEIFTSRRDIINRKYYEGIFYIGRNGKRDIGKLWDKVFRIALTKINYFFFLLGSQVWTRNLIREESEMTDSWYGRVGSGQASYLLMRVYGYINGDVTTQFLGVFELVKFRLEATITFTSTAFTIMFT
ncbi:hypothetical protein RclHR1_10120003 [Rhizophagus clarus]|uniref:Uncharacterized protein n=1 Tax=Rhizophagus clarus TaxID=94130 RepID=A0A2Z6Q0T1_9GLOM|nr:hypothetical protein RclHR1_10120003 [Rhizophagus clarus]